MARLPFLTLAGPLTLTLLILALGGGVALGRTETVSDSPFATARWGLPSPSTCLPMTDVGFDPVLKSVLAAKLPRPCAPAFQPPAEDTPGTFFAQRSPVLAVCGYGAAA